MRQKSYTNVSRRVALLSRQTCVLLCFLWCDNSLEENSTTTPVGSVIGVVVNPSVLYLISRQQIIEPFRLKLRPYFGACFFEQLAEQDDLSSSIPTGHGLRELLKTKTRFL